MERLARSQETEWGRREDGNSALGLLRVVVPRRFEFADFKKKCRPRVDAGGTGGLYS